MEEFKFTHQRVKELNEDLDIKVIGRTKELEIANQKLEKMNEDLTKLSMHDSLTGIYNRFKIFDLASKVEARFKKGNFPACVAMIDIDHFKSINDTYGHLIGDIAVKKVTRKILEGIRENDHVGRIGGEEFLIVLEKIESTNGEQLLENIRRSIENEMIKTNDGDFFQLIVSIGLAELVRDESIEQSIYRADEALYISKRNGRNQRFKHPFLICLVF